MTQTEENQVDGQDLKKAKEAQTEQENEQQSESTQAQSEKQEATQESDEKTSHNQEDYKAKYFYLAAEMDNMRKRFEREKENWIKYGNEKILGSLIEVVDNLDLTVGALDGEADPKVKNILVGVEMVRKQFMEVLASNGLTAVESLGKEFDPNFHEAMGQQEVEGKKENEVITEYKKGYVLNGRLLRAAKVIVAKAKA